MLFIFFLLQKEKELAPSSQLFALSIYSFALNAFLGTEILWSSLGPTTTSYHFPPKKAKEECRLYFSNVSLELLLSSSTIKGAERNCRHLAYSPVPYGYVLHPTDSFFLEKNSFLILPTRRICLYFICTGQVIFKIE